MNRAFRLAVAVFAVGLGALSLTSCAAYPPPIMGTAGGGNHQATVSWQAPLAAPFPIAGYEVMPIVGLVPQTPVVFNSTATTQTITGLTNGTTYTFQVAAINSRGRESAWSEPSNAVTPAPPVAVGGDHTCALLTGGSAKCWGRNTYGALGDGTNTNSSTPVSVVGISTATGIAAGAAHTCALLTSGTVTCWGKNTQGQLGNGATTDSTTPVSVVGITTATAITAGWEHTCALLVGGAVKCWGQNIHGELGDGTSTERHTPVVSGITTANAISAGDYHTCAVLTGGTAKCWGWNGYGQLGNGTTGVYNPTPMTVAGITTATAIAAGGGHTCALLVDGTANCFGDNGAGQLGDGTTTGRLTPVAVGITTATAITAGWEHTCALLVDGTANCWGYNSNGQLGYGGDYTDAANPTPAAVTGITTAVVIDAGVSHTCALLTGGTAKCWGDNTYGQLGNGTTTNSTSPVTVIGL